MSLCVIIYFFPLFSTLLATRDPFPNAFFFRHKKTFGEARVGSREGGKPTRAITRFFRLECSTRWAQPPHQASGSVSSRSTSSTAGKSQTYTVKIVDSLQLRTSTWWYQIQNRTNFEVKWSVKIVWFAECGFWVSISVNLSTVNFHSAQHPHHSPPFLL